MIDENAKDHMRLAAINSVNDREERGQSPVPSHCIRFDLRKTARQNESPSNERVVVTATVGDADDLVPFELDDVPGSDDELQDLLSDEPSLKRTGEGWTVS